MSVHRPSKGPKVVGRLPGDADQQVESIWALGAIAVTATYAIWASATNHSFVPGALAFIEGLWLVIVLLWLAAWDLGAWISGARPLHNPIAALVAPRWLVESLAPNLRTRLRRFFDEYVHIVGLLVGLAIGHVFWH